MANKKKKSNVGKMYKSEIVANTSFRESMLKIVKILVVVLIIFGIFYLLTVYLTNRKDSSTKKSIGDAIIQYEEILAGSSFNMGDDQYIVIYYDKSDEELKSNIVNSVTSYQEKDTSLPLYTVDMSSAFNSKFSSGPSNTYPNTVHDLRIDGPTLIKFDEKRVVDYVEGSFEIGDYLK